MDEVPVEIKAVQFAERFYDKLGWKVVNVSKVRGSHSGYDLFLEKDGQRLNVEVKGCTRLFQIPDLFSTEIDRETLRLIADELCVVYYSKEEGFLLGAARIPRAALLAEHITIKYGYRISGRFKNERCIGPIMVDRSELQDVSE
jgi:hypothetical protein